MSTQVKIIDIEPGFQLAGDMPADVPANETDPVFGQWLSDTPPVMTEVDPVFTASPAANIIDSGTGNLFLADDGTYKAAGGGGSAADLEWISLDNWSTITQQSVPIATDAIVAIINASFTTPNGSGVGGQVTLRAGGTESSTVRLGLSGGFNAYAMFQRDTPNNRILITVSGVGAGACQGSIDRYKAGSGGGGGGGTSTPLSTSNMTFSRDATSASATVTYNHSLGVIPKVIIFSMKVPGYQSDGSYAEGLNKCVVYSSDGGVGSQTDANNCIRYAYQSGNFQKGYVTNLTSTTFDIVWTKAGGPTGTLQIEATLIGGGTGTTGKDMGIDTLTFTRDASIAGTQVISHNLGMVPKKITIHTMGQIFNGHDLANRLIHGGYDGITNNCISDMTGTGLVGNSDSYCVLVQDTAYGTAWRGAVTARDATTFTITWSKVGSPTGTAYCYVEVEGGGSGSGGTLDVAVGTINRDMSTASNVQVIPHGLGRMPKKVESFWALNASTFNVPMYHSIYNGTSIASLVNDNSNPSQRILNTYYAILFYPTPYSYVSATITMDATNITLTWVKSGNPTGNLLVTRQAE